jgi:dihydrofolate reductase
MKPEISLIACIGKNRELGYKNDLIWKIPEDLKYFRDATTGKPVIMGLNTYYSIGKPLPNRLNIVLSDKEVEIDGVSIARTLEDALRIARESKPSELFFIGGAYVYSQAIKIADKLYLTLIDDTSNADVYFPEYSDFKVVEKLGQGEYNRIKYEFLILKKDGQKR